MVEKRINLDSLDKIDEILADKLIPANRNEEFIIEVLEGGKLDLELLEVKEEGSKPYFRLINSDNMYISVSARVIKAFRKCLGEKGVTGVKFTHIPSDESSGVYGGWLPEAIKKKVSAKKSTSK